MTTPGLPGGHIAGCTVAVGLKCANAQCTLAAVHFSLEDVHKALIEAQSGHGKVFLDGP